MDLGLTNKTVIVLGASSGLGLAIAKCLAEEKARVVMSCTQRRASRSSRAQAMDAGETSIRELKPGILFATVGHL